MTINDIFQFGALVGKVEVDLLNKDDDNYRRQVLHSEKVNNIWTSYGQLDNMVNMNSMDKRDTMKKYGHHGQHGQHGPLLK